MRLVEHFPTGTRIVERDLYATGYAPMSVEYTVFCCSCGDEYASKPDLLAHLIEEVSKNDLRNTDNRTQGFSLPHGG